MRRHRFRNLLYWNDLCRQQVLGPVRGSSWCHPEVCQFDSIYNGLRSCDNGRIELELAAGVDVALHKNTRSLSRVFANRRHSSRNECGLRRLDPAYSHFGAPPQSSLLLNFRNQELYTLSVPGSTVTSCRVRHSSSSFERDTMDADPNLRFALLAHERGFIDAGQLA